MQSLFIQRSGATFALLLFTALMPALLFADTATVKNNISVSAEGGNAKASVEMVVNGETVLDEVVEGTDVSITASNDSVATSSADTHRSARDEKLLELIEILQTLIQHYVSLLNAQS